MNRFSTGQFLYIGILSMAIFFWFTNSYAWISHFWQIAWCLLATVHVFFAIGIARDAAKQQSANAQLFFVEPLVWGLATFVGGLFMVIVYWVFHYSTLRRG